MLELNNIVKDYISGDTRVTALKGINLRFRDSEFVSILGQSGCGKTTMLNIIGGLDQYTSGDLKINGRSTKKFKDRDWDAYRYNSIGFVFQSYNLIPHQTVLANVELALTLSGVSKSERRKRAIEALEKVGMADFAARSFSTLSGGEQQRVILARALAQQTPCLILDEPTNHLDITHQLQLLKIVKQLDVTVISAIHDLNIAAMFCDRLYVLKNGEIVAEGTPREVLTRELIREIYEVESDIVEDSKGNMHILFY